MGRFSGKVAIVTGGASGIGAATVARLASEGAKVLIADINAPAEMPEGEVLFQRTDATSEDEIAAAVAVAVEKWGRIDALFNNAGMGSMGDTVETEPSLWDRVFAINVRGVYLFARAVIPVMARGGGGAIVNTASISGMGGDFGMAAYNASKGAVVNLTRSMAMDCAAKGIRVNALCPGLVETPMASPAIVDPADREHWFDRIPLGRAARPAEMAAVAAFLLSDDASYMTGAIIAADGGVTAHTGQPNFVMRKAQRAQRNGG